MAVAVRCCNLGKPHDSICRVWVRCILVMMLAAFQLPLPWCSFELSSIALTYKQGLRQLLFDAELKFSIFDCTEF